MRPHTPSISSATSASRSASICHSEWSRPILSSRFAPAKWSACGVEESAFSFGVYRGGSAAGGSFVAGGAACGAGLEATDFPTVKYFRILSRRFGPSPRIASKSSTLLNEPYDLRICKILPAVTGPIPGTSCSSSKFAVLILIGCAGGFFLARTPDEIAQSTRKQREIRTKVRNAIAVI